MDTDVLVVGAGPTGLTLAGDLARAGVRCTVLERRADEGNTTRAFAVHARTLEELDARGVADELIATGTTVKGVRLFDRAQLDLSWLPSRFPYVLVTPQYQTERVLAERATALGATIVHGARLGSLTQTPDEVTATTEDGRTYRAKYLVGCDGVRSAVRDALGLPYPGKAVVKSILLADVRLTEDPADVLAVDARVGGFAFIAPFGDGWYRIFAWDGSDLPDSAPVTLDQVRATTRKVFGTDFGMHDPRFLSRFHSDERQAPHYRVGRVFLAGDAAHCHSPAGGMGMNTGIQDAANLGWKLALAVRGHASDALLDSYEAERHPVGRTVLRVSGAIVRVAIVRTRFQRLLRTTLARTALRLPSVRHKGALTISGIGIGYGNGVERVADRPLRDGRRLYEALRDGAYLLVGHPSTDVTAWADRVHVAEPGDGDRAGGGSADADPRRLTLVRPDGYAAWSGDASDTAGLRAALTRWCGPVTATADA